LSLPASAQLAVVNEFAHYGAQHFQWFGKAGHGWIPDFDNDGTGMPLLELKLMQCESNRIQPLSPAKGWGGGFYTPAPHKTVGEGHLEMGRSSK